MTRQRPARGDGAGAGKPPDDAGSADVIEIGGHPLRWPSLRWPWGGGRGPATSIVLAALGAGLVLGFIGGHLQAGVVGTATKATTPATVVPAGEAAIGAPGGRCAVQMGRTLQLGIEIMNQSDRTVALRQIKPVLPLRGLQPIASRWGTCGSLPEPGLAQATSLAPGATGWLTVTFEVMVVCPQPLPVEFKVSYMQAGRLVTAQFDSFPDLGQVRYNNCRTVP